MSMDCNELVELITDYLEGSLPAEDVDRFEDHLAECPACRLYLEQMRGVIKTVGQFEEKHISSEAKEKLLRVFSNWKKGV